MPDFRYTGTLRIESNDPATPREIGLQALQSSFIAPVTFASYEAEATVYGITEYADLTDPPQKYLVAQTFGAMMRHDSVISPQPTQEVVVGVFGSGNTEVRYWRYDAATGTALRNGWFYSSGGAGTRGGLGGTYPITSFEAVNWSSGAAGGGSDWSPYFPGSWTKSKTVKFFVPSDLPPTPNNVPFWSRNLQNPVAGNSPYIFRSPFTGIGRSTGSTGVNGTTADMRVIGVTWTGNHYAMEVYIGGDGFTGIGTVSQCQLFIKAAYGNQDPGTADQASGGLFLSQTATASASTGNVERVVTFALPPGISIAFMVKRAGGGWTELQGLFPDTQQTPYGYDRWIYLPDPTIGETPYLLKWEERLFDLNPVVDRLIEVPGVTIGNDIWAGTSSLSGGTGTESHDPIIFTGRGIRASFRVTGLTPLTSVQLQATFQQVAVGGSLSSATFIQSTYTVFPGLDTFVDVEIDVLAPVGFLRRLYSVTQVGQEAIYVPPAPGTTAQILTSGRAIEEGVVYTASEQAAVSGFLDELSTKPYKNNLKYVLPFFGNDLTTQLFPIWDVNFYGPPTNNNFVDADGSTATGLRGNGTTKYLTMPFRHSFLQSTSQSGEGVFFNQCDWGGDSGQYIGGNWESGNTQIFGLRIGDYRTLFYHGTTTFPAGDQTTPVTNAHYFGIAKSDTDRKIYRNGVLIGSDTNVVNSSGAGANSIVLFADTLSGIRENASSLFCAYYTDGSAIWTDANVLDLHNLIQTHLINAVGRSVSTKNPDMATFETRVAKNAGTLTANSLTYASDLIDDLRAWAGYPKIHSIYGLLGADLAAAVVQVYSPALPAVPTISNFVLADFDENVGLTGNGSNKKLQLSFRPNNVGSSSNGGMGVFSMTEPPAGQTFLGYQTATGGDTRFTIAKAGGGNVFGSWGLQANTCDSGSADAIGHWYMQRLSATERKLFRDGALADTDVTNDPATDSGSKTIPVFCLNTAAGSDVQFLNATLGLFYFTNGQLSDAEVAELHTILSDFITATGR